MHVLPRLLVLALLALPLVAEQPAQTAGEVLSADTPRTTVAGNSFLAPAGWTLSVHDRATILEAPEANSRIALIDVQAKDADGAVAAAWSAYGVEPKWPLVNINDAPDKDGWTNRRVYNYQTSPSEKRIIQVSTVKANDVWTVLIFDMDQAVADKRGAQLSLIFGRRMRRSASRRICVRSSARIRWVPVATRVGLLRWPATGEGSRSSRSLALVELSGFVESWSRQKGRVLSSCVTPTFGPLSQLDIGA